MTILPLLSQPNRCVSIWPTGGSVRFYSILGCLGVAWAMSACAENPSHLNMTYLDRYADPNPTLASILECHGFSCSETSRATLNREAWRRVTAAFVPRARNAQTTFPAYGLEFELNRRIIGFHNSRHIQPRHGRQIVRENRTYFRWCFADLVTACDFIEQFGGALAETAF